MKSVIPTCCPHDCGGKCLLLVHMHDGKVKKITTTNDPQLRACLRGLSYHERVYSKDRLKYPMIRTGKRGKGKFRRISWDEALDIVANEMKEIKEVFGNSAFLLYAWSGNTGQLHGTWKTAPDRLLNMFGGKSEVWGITSFEGAIFASRYMFGVTPRFPFGFPGDSNEPDDLLNSQLIIMWGWNPLDTIQGTATSWYLSQAKKSGCKIISVDPVHTTTSRILADQWIPIRPGTDTAVMLSIAYVIVEEKLQDQEFLDAYTIGFEKFRSYIAGDDDGIPKKPIWAEKISGVPAPVIADLARQYARIKPAALIHGFGPGRTAFGEEYHRAAITLQAMTGNIGVHGGYAGTLWGAPIRMGTFPIGNNPVEVRIKTDKWADCVLLGREGKYPCDIEMMYIVGGNPLNQIQNINKSVRALRKVNFILVQEQFMTPTAKFADILLPVNTSFEKNDIYLPWLKGRCVIYNNKVFDSMYESKSDLEICTELARKLGVQGFNPYTEDEWLRGFVSKSDIPDYDELRSQGFYKFDFPEPWVAFKKQIEDPENNPFPTPSGKIEIYSETLDRMVFQKSVYGEHIPSIPTYIEPWEGVNDRLARRYPLQLITPHFKYRANSVFYNVRTLRRRYRHEVWINPRDARRRGVSEGDSVRVFNTRGSIIIVAKVTDRIVKGVVSVYEGTYYEPDNGEDMGGSANMLTKDAPSPAGAFPYNTCLVEVQKIEG